MPLTATELRSDLYRVLDEVLATGKPIEILRNGRILRIVPEERTFSFAQLAPRPGAVTGDPADLVHLDWSGEWSGKLP